MLILTLMLALALALSLNLILDWVVSYNIRVPFCSCFWWLILRFVSIFLLEKLILVIIFLFFRFSHHNVWWLSIISVQSSINLSGFFFLICLFWMLWWKSPYRSIFSHVSTTFLILSILTIYLFHVCISVVCLSSNKIWFNLI